MRSYKHYPGRNIVFGWDSDFLNAETCELLEPEPHVTIEMAPDDPIILDGLLQCLSVRFRLEDAITGEDVSKYLMGRNDTIMQHRPCSDGGHFAWGVGDSLRITKRGIFRLKAEVWLRTDFWSDDKFRLFKERSPTIRVER